MIIASLVLCIVGLSAFLGGVWKAREARRDEGRMASYVASLKAVASDHRARIAELELSLAHQDELMAAQDRLLEGQARHLRTLDPRYAG